MAGNIQGLTVIINGDATSLSKAMREARAEAGILKGHMTALNKLLKLDPSNMSLIARQQMLMNAQMAQGATRLNMLRRAEQEFYASVGPHSEAEIRQFERLQAEITKTELAMAQLRAEAIAMGAGASASTLAWAGRLEKMSAAIQKVSTAALVLSASTALIGAMSIKSAYDFEQSFAGVRKTIIATDEEYAKLARISRDIALNKPIDVNDVNEIMMYAGQLNIATEHLGKFAGVMADLDVATDMDLEDGSMQLARFMNICNTSQGDVDRLGATIVDLGNNSATTESQIMLMAMRIAGTASNVGMSEQNILALAAALSATGIQAEMGGNAISTIIRRIDKDVDKGTESLATWASVAGMSASEFATAWKTDVAGAFQKVVSGMGRFQDEGGSLNLLLDELHISYMRQVDVMQRVSRSGDMMAALFARADTAWANNTALVREATQRYDTAASKTKMMMNAFNELGITLGNEILPHFKDIVLGITGAVQAFAKMDDGTKTTVINILGAVTATGLLVKALELVTGAGAKLIRFLASMKTAMGLMSLGQLTYTNMTIATTAAVTGETAALEANGIAMVQNMTFTQALSGAVTALAARFVAAAAAVGLSTFAFAAVVVGIAAAVVAVGMFLKSASEAADSTNELTSASKDMQAGVEAATIKYNALVAAQGETSDAALVAKAAMEEERAAFEANKETVGEFCDRMGDLVEAHEQTKESMRDTASDAESEAGAMLYTMERIKELAAVEDDDIQRKAQLAGLVNTLNNQVDGLNLSYDANTDTLKSNADAWEAVVKAKANDVRDEAYLKNFNSTLAEQVELETALAEAEKECQEAKAAWEKVDPEMTHITKEGDAYGKMVGTVNELSAAYEENKAQQQLWLEKMSESQVKSAAISEALSLVNTQLYDEQAAVDAVNNSMGTAITVEDLHERQLVEEAEAAAEASEEISKLAEMVADLCDEYPALVDMLNDAGVSIEDFAEQLQEAGISADELAKGVQDMADKVQNGLERIEVDSEMSLDKFMENLEHNREVTANWAEYTRTAFSHTSEKGTQEFLTYIHSLGPEYAGLMEDLSRLSTEELDEVARQWKAGGETGADAYMAGLTPVLEGARNIANDVSQALPDELDESAPQVARSALAISHSILSSFGEAKSETVSVSSEMMDGYESGISSSGAPEAAASVASGVESSLRIGDTDGIGRAAILGLIAGMNGIAWQAYTTAASIAGNVADSLRSALQINSPSRVTREIGKGVGEGLVLGMEDGMSDVNRASVMLANAAVPDVGDAVSAASTQFVSSLFPSRAMTVAAAGASSSNSNYEINLNLAYDASDDAADLARGVARKLGAIMDMRG